MEWLAAGEFADKTLIVNVLDTLELDDFRRMCDETRWGEAGNVTVRPPGSTPSIRKDVPYELKPGGLPPDHAKKNPPNL